jgi:hypothetical protein
MSTNAWGGRWFLEQGLDLCLVSRCNIGHHPRRQMTHICLLDYKQPRVRGLWITRQDNGHEEVLIITIGEQLVLAQCAGCWHQGIKTTSWLCSSVPDAMSPTILMALVMRHVWRMFLLIIVYRSREPSLHTVSLILAALLTEDPTRMKESTGHQVEPSYCIFCATKYISLLRCNW